MGDTGIGFANTITGAVGIDFLAAGATGTSSDYNSNGQLPSYGIVGQCLYRAVCRHARAFDLHPACRHRAIAAIVRVIRRRKVAV